MEPYQQTQEKQEKRNRKVFFSREAHVFKGKQHTIKAGGAEEEKEEMWYQ